MVKGGKRKGSNGSKSSAGATAKLQEDAWAQCDNPNCQKWRRLPPGTVIDEDTPWYCYMNPDEAKAACEAPEESYNYDVEVDWDAAGYDEPKASSSSKRSKSKAGTRHLSRASSDWSDSPRSNLGSSSQNRKRSMDMFDEPYEPKRSRYTSRDDLHGSGEYQPDADRPETLGSAGASGFLGTSSGGIRQSTRPKRPPSLPLKEESPPPSSGRAQGSFRQPQAHHRPSSKAAQAAALRPTQKARKQHKGFEKLLSLGGLWEIVKGKGKAITPAPFWVWEGLATHTPAAAELAAHAADVASAARYFESSQYPAGPVQASEAAALKRQAMTAAAVLGLDVTSRIPDVVAPIPTRSAVAKQAQTSALPHTQLSNPRQAAQHAAQTLVQAQFQSQSQSQYQAQPPGPGQQSWQLPQQGQQPGLPKPQPQPVSQPQPSSGPQHVHTSQQGLSQVPSAPQLAPYSQAQLLSLVMPRPHAQAQAQPPVTYSQAQSQAPVKYSQAQAQAPLTHPQAQSQPQQSSSALLVGPQVSQPLSHMALQSLVAQSASQQPTSQVLSGQAQQGRLQPPAHPQGQSQPLSSGQNLDQQAELQPNGQAQAAPLHPASFQSLLQRPSSPAVSQHPPPNQSLGQPAGHNQAAVAESAVQSQPLSLQGTAGLMQLIQQQAHVKQQPGAQTHAVPASSSNGVLASPHVR